ncbi:MAG: peptidylprolyl isomerase [Planctomycetes bacterium]|nr:peptidylprolyl isomerase [Planctomycetota bacterium]
MIRAAALALFLMMPVWVMALDSENAFEFPEPSLPKILVRLPGDGTVTSSELRNAVQLAASANPREFDLREGFVRDVMLTMEYASQNITQPDVMDIGKRVRLAVEQSGGEDAFKLQLDKSGMTMSDIKRVVSKWLMLEKLVRALKKIPDGTEVKNEETLDVLKELGEKYKPRFYDLGIEKSLRVATVGGRNFTSDEVVNWLILNMNEKQLASILDNYVDEKLVVYEANAKGLDIKGKNQAAILAMLFADALTDEALEKYAAGIAKELTVVKTRHIFFAFDRRPGRAYVLSNVDAGNRAKAKARADAVLAAITRNELSFEKCADKYSDCPSASSGGDLGYLARSYDIAAGIPPEAYGLDMIATSAGKRTPISAAPLPEIFIATGKLQDGGVSPVVETSTGYSIINRIETRAITRIEYALPYLRVRRLNEKLEALLTYLKTGGEVSYFWRPSGADLKKHKSDVWVESKTEE